MFIFYVNGARNGVRLCKYESVGCRHHARFDSLTHQGMHDPKALFVKACLLITYGHH
jgi:hypothetical protein